jgi:simple sugar transport system permease protein
MNNIDIKQLLHRLGPFLGLIFIFMAGVITNGATFLNLYNQLNVLGRIAIIGLPAIGMTLVIISAGIDLSVGSLASLSSVICAMLLMERSWTRAAWIAVPAIVMVGFAVTYIIFIGMATRYYRRNQLITLLCLLISTVCGYFVWSWSDVQVQNGFSTIAVLIAVPVVGLFMGILNGTIIAKGRIQPFIVTLGMMSVAVGLAKFIAGKGGQIHPVYYAASGYSAEGTTHTAPASFDLLSSKLSIFGVEIFPATTLFFFIAAILAWIILMRLRVGRHIYAIGGNEETARLSGIKTDRVKIFVYAVSGFLSALAGVLYCSAYTQGKSDAGLTWELDAIAAVVIGGTSLMGGRGTISGTVVGVLIIGYLSNILNLMEVSSEIQDILKGVIIVGAVLIQEGTVVRWLKKIRN